MDKSLKAEANLFRDLGHPVRLKILCLLMRRERECVCRMLVEVGVPQPTISRHLATLRGHGIIEDEREGTMVFYRVANPLTTDILAAAGLACAAEAKLAKDNARPARASRKGGRAA